MGNRRSGQRWVSIKLCCHPDRGHACRARLSPRACPEAAEGTPFSQTIFLLGLTIVQTIRVILAHVVCFGLSDNQQLTTGHESCHPEGPAFIRTLRQSEAGFVFTYAFSVLIRGRFCLMETRRMLFRLLLPTSRRVRDICQW